MMKKYFNWMLMASLVMGLSFSVASCKDDDDDNKGTEQRSDVDPLDNEESQTAFRWLCALASVDGLDANWKSKTYEPTVGVASENNEYTRIVVVETLDEAKVDFASFADKKVEELGSKVVVSGGAAGTMTWEPSKAGASNLAVVDVKSNILPHLQKLVYCTQDQVGQNGIFGNDMKGTPYYRFGDVIQDPDGYYWVCVRPCFAANPDDKTGYKDTKGDSHWINIFNAAETGDNKAMPKDNIKDKWNNLDKYKNQTILLPTQLAYDREHLFNLTQLIWALVNPEKYKDFCSNNTNSALGGFPYTYNGENFLKSVATYWNIPDANNRTIWQKLFNHTYEEMKKLKQIDLFYNGYSWTIGNSGYCWRYTSKEYAKAYSGSASDDKEEFNFVQDGFDITHFAQTPNSKSLPWSNFFQASDGNTGRWVVRYMRGDKLMTGGKFNYYAKITSSKGNVTDVYRYNEKKGIDAGANMMPERDDDAKVADVKPLDAPALCSIIGADGKFYKTVNDAKAANNSKDALAIVVALNGNKRVEKGQDFNGLAMALTIKSGIKWYENIPKNSMCDVTEIDEFQKVKTALDGIALTTKFVGGCGKNHNHVAATYCRNYTPALTAEQRQQLGFSEWFMPAIGQCVIAMKALGLSWDDKTGYEFANHAAEINALKEKFAAAGVAEDLTKCWLWTSSVFSDSQFGDSAANLFSFSYTDMFGSPLAQPAGGQQKSVPFIAFKYNGGATQD